MDTMLNPVLYSKGKKGEIRFWKVWTEGSEIITEHGVVDGKVQQARKTAKAKNIGKSNETTEYGRMHAREYCRSNSDLLRGPCPNSSGLL